MPENFLLEPSNSVPAMPVAVPKPQPPRREPLKVMLIGSAKGVTRTIEVLHRLGFAQVGDWSPLLPTQNPGEVTSILIRHLLL